MISGRDALGHIDRALQEEQGRLTAVENQISSVSERLIALQRDTVEDYRALARLRVDMIATGDPISRIDAADRQVAQMLGAREQAAADLGQKITVARQAVQALETERARQADQVDDASDRVDEAEASTQARLDQLAEYRAQRDRAQEAERIARHAEDKAAHSEREQEEKGDSYREDPLFMYLWDRGYGTTEYDGGRLTRWLDDRVARLIGFEDARANYHRLREIPLRLREYADARQVDAEAQFEALRALDEAARGEDGVDALEQSLAKEQEHLEGIDARIEQAESDLLALQAQQQAFGAGEDQHYRAAVQYLATEFSHDDLQGLRRDAMATPFPEDDLIVSRLSQHEDEGRSLEATRGELNDAVERHRQRRQELESLRLDFRRQRFDRSGSTFSDGGLVALMLANFLSGMLDRDNLWRVLREQQRYRPRRSNPTFGSGGFGRGSPWGGGGWRGGSGGGLGGGGLGRGGGAGGGGFRTGGGF